MTRDTAIILKRFHYCESALVRAQSAWLAGLCTFDVKTQLPQYTWQHALTAGELRNRVFELRFPSRLMEIGEDKTLIDFFENMRHAPSGPAFLAGISRVYLPALAKAYEEFLSYSDTIGDGPTHRFLGLAVQEIEKQIERNQRRIGTLAEHNFELRKSLEALKALPKGVPFVKADEDKAAEEANTPVMDNADQEIGVTPVEGAI